MTLTKEQIIINKKCIKHMENIAEYKKISGIKWIKKQKIIKDCYKNYNSNKHVTGLLTERLTINENNLKGF